MKVYKAKWHNYSSYCSVLNPRESMTDCYRLGFTTNRAVPRSILIHITINIKQANSSRTGNTILIPLCLTGLGKDKKLSFRLFRLSRLYTESWSYINKINIKVIFLIISRPNQNQQLAISQSHQPQNKMSPQSPFPKPLFLNCSIFQ